MHRALLDERDKTDRIAWERAGRDRMSVPEMQEGGRRRRPNPTGRGKPGVDLHVLTDASEAPLAARPGPANRRDMGVVAAMLNVVPSCR